MPRRKGEERGEISAYPRGPADGTGRLAAPESGLSVDPDDIGAQFLSHATEQRPSEWPADAASDAVGEEDWESAGGLAGSFESDPGGWERAVTRSLRIAKLSSEFPRAQTGAHKKERAAPEERPTHGWDEIDLTDESIQEASLFDHEGAELGEVESPRLRTEDVHTHGRPRGGHLAHARRRKLKT